MSIPVFPALLTGQKYTQEHSAALKAAGDALGEMLAEATTPEAYAAAITAFLRSAAGTALVQQLVGTPVPRLVGTLGASPFPIALA